MLVRSDDSVPSGDGEGSLMSTSVVISAKTEPRPISSESRVRGRSAYMLRTPSAAAPICSGKAKVAPTPMPPAVSAKPGQDSAADRSGTSTGRPLAKASLARALAEVELQGRQRTHPRAR